MRLNQDNLISASYQKMRTEEFRRRIYPLSFVCAFIFTCFFILNSTSFGNSHFVIPDLFAVIVFTVAGISIKIGKLNPVLGASFILGMMLVFFAMIILFSGSTHAMLYYYGVVPFFAFFMIGIRGGFYYSGLMMAVVLVFMALGESEHHTLSYTTFELGVFTLLLTFSVFSAWLFEYARERVLAQSYDQNMHYEALLQAIDEVYYRVSMDGIIRQIGDAVTSITGYTVQEVEGEPILKFYADPESRDAYVHALQKNGSVKNYPIGIIGKYGNKIMILMSSRIVKDENGTPMYIEGMFRDVTKEQKSEEERKEHLDYLRALSIVESSLAEHKFEKSIAHALGDLRGIFGCERVFLAPVRGLKKRIIEVNAFVDCDDAYPIDVEGFVKEGEIITYLSSVPQNNGKSFFVIDSIEVLSGYMVDKYQLKSHFMTVLYIKPDMVWLLAAHHCRRKVDYTTAMRRLFVDISHRIQGSLGQFLLQKDLKATVERVEVASKAKSEFMATMSHELRTPLHGVIGLLGELGLEKDALSDEQQKNLVLAQTSAKVLASLIDDVLDLAKVESGNIELQKQSFVLKDALYDALVPFVVKAREKGIALSLEMKSVPEMIEGDVVRLRQVLLNLVGNAMKFTKKGYVRIVVTQDDEMLQINIEDSGIGIDRKKQAEVFKPFSQVHDINILGDNLQEKGTGLGTTISQHFVDMMGGSLTLQSEPNVGSTMTIRVPLKSVGEQRVTAALHMDDFTMLTASQEREKTQALNKGKAISRQWSVLLAEDDPVGRRMAVRRLERAGFRVEAVSDGFEAWERVKKERFDLLLTDIRMPGLDGLELARAIRSFEQENNRDATLIIGLSAFALEEVKADALAAGMNDFISKPVDMDALLIKLDACCDEYHRPINQ